MEGFTDTLLQLLSNSRYLVEIGWQPQVKMHRLVTHEEGIN